jgi:hypothetical protein
MCVCALRVKDISLLTTHDCGGVGASSTQQTLQNFPSFSYAHFLSQQVYWFKVVPWMKTNASPSEETISGIDPFRDRSLPLSPLATRGGASWGSQSSPGFKALRQVSDILPLGPSSPHCSLSLSPLQADCSSIRKAFPDLSGTGTATLFAFPAYGCSSRARRHADAVCLHQTLIYF